jgi:hypothetical protein
MYSEEIIEEYKDVLHRKKFDIPEQLIKDALNHIMVNGVRGERVLSDGSHTLTSSSFVATRPSKQA